MIVVVIRVEACLQGRICFDGCFWRRDVYKNFEESNDYRRIERLMKESSVLRGLDDVRLLLLASDSRDQAAVAEE